MMTADGFADSPAIAYAAAGFAGIAPDYLGLGTGPGVHPYLDVASETSATLDMLRAARGFLQAHGASLRRGVVATGFSQGASAALAVSRALQTGAEPAFRAVAVAGVSGPYDIQHAEIPALLAGRLDPKIGAIYAAYVLVAWNRLHHLYASPATVLRPPYERTVPPLFDGRHTGAQVVAGTPGSPLALLTSAGVQMLRVPKDQLARALAIADSTCSDWRARAPVRLYVVAGDEQVAPQNTQHCLSALRARGTHPMVVELRPLPYQASRHLGSEVTATAAILRWLTR